jgi:HK97 family phage portal protein
VQQAIKCIVDEVKKLNPSHIRYIDSDPVPVRSSTVAAVLREPNPLMSTCDFLEKTMWLLLLNYNAFIIPVYSEWSDTDASGKTITRRSYEALYPIKPVQVDFLQDPTGELYVHFRFANGYETNYPYKDVIHIRYNYSVNEFMGGGVNGQPNHEALLKTLELNHKLLQGVAKAMDASYAVNGLVKYGTIIGEEETKKAIEKFNKMLQNSESGFIPIDLKSEVVLFQRTTQLVDDDTLKFIDEKILRNFGVPLCILTGDYTKSQYEAFYQKTLEPIIIAVSQAFTKALFTDRECSFGNEIKFYPKDLIFMDINQTLEMVRLLGDSGSLYENEKRVAFGLKPLPELEGVRMQSLNYVNIEYAKQYQTGGSDSEK